GLGRHFPIGSYAFAGQHAAFMGYVGEQVRARGDITSTEARIAAGSASAYGAAVRLAAGSQIALQAPYQVRVVGQADGVDLRRLPEPIPVPHVESVLAFTYDATGRFVEPYIDGSAEFGDSVFLGAAIARGSTGRIDTVGPRVRYSGEGEITHLDT